MADFGKCVVRTGDEALSPNSRQEFRGLKSEIDRALRKMIEDAAADAVAMNIVSATLSKEVEKN